MEPAVVMRRIVLGVGACFLALSVQASPERVTPAELQALKDLQQTQLGALKESQQAQLDTIRAQAAAVDKRVDDLSTHVGQGVDRLGVYASLIGTLVTVLLAGLGFLGYVTVTRRTKAEAQDAAQGWFDDRASALEQRLRELENKAAEVHSNIDQTAKSVLDHAAAAKHEADEALANAVRDLQAHMPQGAISAAATQASKDSVLVVQAQAEALKKTPEDSYSYDDWNTRAFAAVAAKQLEEAALFWQRAAQVPNAGAMRVAQALFNRGVAHAQMGQSEAEIATYDELIRRFGEAGEPALRDPVAKAMFNKGFRQGQLGQSEAEIATYDELIRRFGEAGEPGLREQVARAHNGIAFARICDGKALWPTDAEGARGLWNEALMQVAQALARPEPERLSGILLGNRAYALALLGDVSQAETAFAKALRAPVDGGQALYDAAISDLAIHPIDPDQPMRELVERQWRRWQAEQCGRAPTEPPA